MQLEYVDTNTIPQDGQPCVMSLETPSRQWRGGVSGRSVRAAEFAVATERSVSTMHVSTSDCGLASGYQAAADWDSEDFWDSPRLPSEWQPLEYELLEYASTLPPGFADRVGSELESQAHAVSKLRMRTAQLLDKEAQAAAAAASSAASAAARASSQERRSHSPGPGRGFRADVRHGSRTRNGRSASTGTSPARRGITPTRKCVADSHRRGQLAENARQLEQKARLVRRSAEKEMTMLSTRIRATEEQQRQLSKEAADDNSERKRLWEAEAELLRLRCRLQQLDAARRHAQRRVLQQEEEDAQLERDLTQLRAEVSEYRAREPEFEQFEQREEDLRRRLRLVKSQLYTQPRHTPQAAPPIAPVLTEASGVEVIGHPLQKAKKSTLLVRHPMIAGSPSRLKATHELLNATRRRAESSGPKSPSRVKVTPDAFNASARHRATSVAAAQGGA